MPNIETQNERVKSIYRWIVKPKGSRSRSSGEMMLPLAESVENDFERGGNYYHHRTKQMAEIITTPYKINLRVQ